MLVRARRAPVQRIPHKYDVLFPREIRKLDFLLFLIQKRKIRRRLSHRDTHTLSSYVSHISPASYPILASRTKFQFAPSWLPSLATPRRCQLSLVSMAIIPFLRFVRGSTLCSGEAYERHGHRGELDAERSREG